MTRRLILSQPGGGSNDVYIDLSNYNSTQTIDPLNNDQINELIAILPKLEQEDFEYLFTDLFPHNYFFLFSDQTLIADTVQHMPSSTTGQRIELCKIDGNKCNWSIIYDDTGYVYFTPPCYLKNTKISLFNGEYKLVQDITYDDELLVWNFDEGKYDSAKPLWIKQAQTTMKYYHCSFENGITLDLVGSNGKCHRVFNYTDMRFDYAVDCIDKEVYTTLGVTKLISVELREEKVEYYNIITDYHINCFANDVLTSCRYNNIYTIENMKFVKEDRCAQSNLKSLLTTHNLDHYITGLRLEEQTIPIEETIKYCKNLELLKVPYEYNS